VLAPAEGPATERWRQAGVPVDVVRTPHALSRYGSTSRFGSSALALPRMWLRVGRLLRGADVVWANDVRGMLLAGPPARARRVRVVWHVHDATPRPGWPARLAGALAHQIVVPQPDIGWANGLLRFQELPNPVRLPQPEPGPGQPGAVLTLARVHPDKGLDVAIEAAAVLRDRGVVFHWTLAGPVVGWQRDYADALRASVERYGLDAHITLAPEDTEPANRMGGCAVYVQPSRVESQSLAVLEALAAARPVVTSDLPALRDLVCGCGRIVPAGDAIALADAVTELLADPARARELGRRGRARVARIADPKVFADSVRQLVADLVGTASS
jgi:glycosyltransferase involved in cell wall biosynthesis